MVANGNEEDIASSDLELSSLSSSDSFEPKAFEGNPVELKRRETNSASSVSSSGNPKDANSIRSNGTLRKQDSNVIEQIMTHNATEGRSETVDSLQRNGLNINQKAVPDYNNPAANFTNCEFPEEYQLETDTGLVKVQTLQKLNRLESRTSIRSGNSQRKSMRSTPSTDHSISPSAGRSSNSGLDAEKLRKAVEKNKRQIDKYQKHKASGGLKKFLGKIFD